MTTRIIQKNTLSFTCSKSMKYLRTPVDIWDTLKDKYRLMCERHKPPPPTLLH